MGTEVEADIVEIKPEQAEMLLEKNTGNRKVRKAIVERYARDMQGGDWDVNGDAIKESPDGEILDGQHRLLACVQAGVPFKTLFVRNVEPSARITMDTGIRRSFADVLRWKGEKSVSDLGSAIECAMRWDYTGTPAHTGAIYSNAERLAWLDDNPDIREAVRLSSPLRRAPLRFPISASGSFVFRIMRLSPEDAHGWIEGVVSGANLDVNDPMARFRNFCIKAVTRKGTLPREEFAALATKSWNAFLEGREIRLLSWKRGGVQREEFPSMLAPDGRSYEEFLTDPNPDEDSAIQPVKMYHPLDEAETA